MDPHTARCLQLSTSFRVPSQIQRSRLSLDTSCASNPSRGTSVPRQIRPAMTNATVMPSQIWQSPSSLGTSLPPGLTPTGMSSSPSSASSSPAQDMAPPHNFPDLSASLAGTGYGDVGTPFDIVHSAGPWWSTNPYDVAATYSPMLSLDAEISKSATFGPDLVDLNATMAPLAFNNLSDPFNDNLGPLESIECCDSESHMTSDRRNSVSANIDTLPLSNPNWTDPASNSFVQTENVLSFPQCNPYLARSFADALPMRRGRSLSQAPGGRATSVRRFRRGPYSANHTRSSSVMSASSLHSVFPSSLPSTQCCSPVEESRDASPFMTELPSYTIETPEATPLELTTGKLDLGSNEPLSGFFSAWTVGHNPTDSQLAATPSTHLDAGSNRLATLPSTPLDSNDAGMPSSSDASDQPNLFSALSEEQSTPDADDMEPADPALRPTEQEMRFDGDLYTPQFVRGHGNKREGYCGMCKPGRWLVLKNSAFWYDKSFSHGISAATGQPFEAPLQTRRAAGTPDVWEGLCGHCHQWIALVSNKKKGTTWFRHAYKCHNQQKPKDSFATASTWVS